MIEAVARRDGEVQYSFWLDRDLLKHLRKHAVDAETNAAELIRRYIVEGLTRDGDPPPS